MGVVHHSKYVNWFEVGRTEFLREQGMDYKEVETLGLMLPVLEVNVKYHQPARYDDLIAVHTAIESYKGVRITFSYDIKKGEKLLVSGQTTHCFTNLDFRPTPVQKVNKELHHLIKQLI